ncbi:MAG TPA: 3'-5' exonuclease, partial [Crocinitomicaceae bacterium]|nr:3'-5' exonuclease [Crocinitomicaceae bacterium]
LTELNNPYIHHLSDLAFNFDLNFGPDINAFWEYYEKTGFKSSIQTPENKDAIKIMTSHKSKGLEFKVVIIPQLDSNFLKSKSQYLVALDDELAYTTISAKVVSPELKEKYNEEYKAALLDKLNLCYVDFTRAVDRLYVMSSFAKTNKTGFASTYFHPFIQAFATADNLIYSDENRFHLQFGKRIKTTDNQKNTESNERQFKPTDISDKLWFPSISLKRQLDDVDTSLETNLRYGRQLHFLLSELENFNSNEDILNAYIKKGLVEQEFYARLLSDLQKITQNETYIELHQNKRQTINEQSIILSESEVKRPDKIILKANETIVLDFKTGLKTPKNIKQVKSYCEILTQMDFPNVKGVILYTQDLDFVWI